MKAAYSSLTRLVHVSTTEVGKLSRWEASSQLERRLINANDFRFTVHS